MGSGQQDWPSRLLRPQPLGSDVSELSRLSLEDIPDDQVKNASTSGGIWLPGWEARRLHPKACSEGPSVPSRVGCAASHSGSCVFNNQRFRVFETGHALIASNTPKAKCSDPFSDLRGRGALMKMTSFSAKCQHMRLSSNLESVARLHRSPVENLTVALTS